MAGTLDPTRTQTVAPPEHSQATLSGSTVSHVEAVLGGDPDDAPHFAPPKHSGDLGCLGRYRILRRLGAGGMGAVYLGHDEVLDRRLALKVMLPRYAVNPQAKTRFLREARTAGQVRSEHVVAILDVDEIDGIPFIAMEFLRGVPLDRFLAANSNLKIPQVIRFGMEAARGLDAAHSIGLVHRDIKPANLFLESPLGRVKILDFGIAKEVESDGGGDVTRTGQVLGTPAYMSPEQARGEAVDHRSNLFSLGVVLYKLATGVPPFRGANAMAVVMALGSDEPTPVRELNPAAPEAVATLIHRMLAKRPENRPQSAAEVHSALVAVEDGTAEATAATEADYVPIAVPVASGEVWSRIDESRTDAPVAIPAEPKRKSFPWQLAGAVVSALVIVGVLAAVFLRGKPEPAVAVKEKEPEPPPVVPKTPAKPKDDPERKAAETLHPHGLLRLSLASRTNVSITTAQSLPTEPFKVIEVYFDNLSKPPHDECLAALGELHEVTRVDDGYRRLALTEAEMARVAAMPFAEKLTNLAVPSVSLTSAVATELARFKKLNQLIIGAEAADDASLKHLARELPGIRSLTLIGLGQSGRVTTDGFTALTALPLQSLWLYWSRNLTNEWCSRIVRMPNLQTLRLISCNVDDDMLAALVGHKATSFTCTGPNAKVTDKGMDSIARMTTLQSLDLDGIPITDDGLNQLGALKRLTTLGLSRTGVTHAGVMKFKDVLPGCATQSTVYDPKLDPDRIAAEWILSKPKTTVTLAGISQWAKTVEELPTRGPLRITDASFVSSPYAMTVADLDILAPLTGLTSISAGRTAFGNDGLEKMSRFASAKNLASLSLGGPNITDDGLKHLAGMKSLRLLSTSYTSVTGSGFGVLHGLPELAVLYPGGQVTDEGLRQLRGLQRLARIELRLTKISDAGVEPLADLPALKNLSLISTRVTDKCLTSLARSKSLVELHLNDTAISEAAVAEFRKAKPDCVVVGRP